MLFLLLGEQCAAVFYFTILKKEEMPMSKKQITDEAQTIKPDLLRIYEICETHGISKEVISCFLKYQTGGHYEQDTTRT